jgi:hypothetical protein
MREWLDPSHVQASSRRMTSSGLVIVGAMEIMAPLIAALVIDIISILATVLNP